MVQKMITGLESSEIRIYGLFLNTDAGFDTKEFRGYCSDVEIIGNIDQNKRNGIIKITCLITYCINADWWWNGLMHGLMLLKLF